MSLTRAYALLHVKAVDPDRRIITGIATTPTPDRVGDIVEPRGVRFQNPLPLLLFHDSQRPVGSATFLPATDKGIPFEATLPEILEPGTLKDRVDEAWQSVKYGLIKGVSIGFRVSSPDHIERLRNGGVRFKAMEVVELSLVPVPANHEAVIQTVKSLDAPYLAATGTQADAQPSLPGVAGPVKLAPKDARPMTTAEQIKSFEATRETKRDRMTTLMNTAQEKGETLAPVEAEEYDTLKGEIDAINQHICRLQDLEQVQKASAVPVRGATPAEAEATRNATGRSSVITVKSNRAPGIGFARMARVTALAYKKHANAIELARDLYPDDPEIQQYLKANVTAHNTTTDSALVNPTTLATEFVDWLRPKTIIGRLEQLPVGPRRVPFNVRIGAQTAGGSANWVGEGKPKPLTRLNFAATTLGFTKVAAISVITEELMRFSNPSAEALIRDGLAAAIIERIDTDLVDPAVAAVSGVHPASLTNGVTPLGSAGPTADNVKTDLNSLISAFIVNNMDPSGLVLLMPTTLALALSIQTNSLGQREFADVTMNGGTLLGIPVITSQYLADASGGAGNMVVAVNLRDIFLADDGQVQIDISDQVSLQMLDNPTNDSVTPTATSMVSMWQTNSVALRAERFINWAKARSEAVVYMDDVSWGSAGSPA